MQPGWYDVLKDRANNFANEVWIPKIGPTVSVLDFKNAEHIEGGIAGYFSFLPRKAAEIVYPIPSGLKHWFGDQYMFEKLRANGWKITVLDSLRAQHEQSSVTASNPEAYKVIEQDKAYWRELGGTA
jgi:hypothetical protein